MESSNDLEKRLQRELRQKLEFLQRAPARPSEGMVRRRLKESGDKCFEAADIIEKAQREFVNLMTSQDEFLKGRGGALHFYVKLNTLYCEHQQHRSDIVRDVENFVMAHEWYELLVAANEADELERLAFLHELNEEVFLEPTQLGHPRYPEVLETHRNYERRNVTVMVRSQLIQIDALLQEEKEATAEAWNHSKLTKRLEEAILTDLRTAMENLQLEVQDQIQEVKQRMDILEEKIDGLREHVKEMKLEDETGIRNPPSGHPTNEQKNARAGLKGRQPEEDLEELKHDYERRIRQGEEELYEIDRYLSTNIGRERHFGDRRMKDSEYYMMCVYCRETGTHYSDACPVYRLVKERIDVLLRNQRCLVCLEQHDGGFCKKKGKCFYCNYGLQDSLHYSDHHASICSKPEKLAETQRHRGMVMEQLEHYRKLLAELETRMCQPSSSSA